MKSAGELRSDRIHGLDFVWLVQSKTLLQSVNISEGSLAPIHKCTVYLHLILQVDHLKIERAGVGCSGICHRHRMQFLKHNCRSRHTLYSKVQYCYPNPLSEDSKLSVTELW